MITKKEIKSWAAQPQQAIQPPKNDSTNDVRIIEGIMPEIIYWKGRQWEVTNYGVQAPSRRYFIEANRVWEDEGTSIGWKQHMSRKPWIDMQDFIEALTVARVRWPKLVAPN